MSNPYDARWAAVEKAWIAGRGWAKAGTFIYEDMTAISALTFAVKVLVGDDCGCLTDLALRGEGATSWPAFRAALEPFVAAVEERDGGTAADAWEYRSVTERINRAAGGSYLDDLGGWQCVGAIGIHPGGDVVWSWRRRVGTIDA